MTAPARAERTLAWFVLKDEIESFLYEEADLLDARRYDAWLDCFADDLVYFMPMRRNVKLGTHEAQENTRFEHDISWFNEDKWTLGKRIEQLRTGYHWAEEPLSRVCHLVTNVRLVSVAPSPEDAREVVASSRFVVYQNRVEYEQYFFVGRRTDTLRRTDAGWQIARRELLLDQNVLLAKNLTVLF